MPISTKRIIQTVAGLPAVFTRKDIQAALERRESGDGKRNAGKRRSVSQKDQPLIDRTLKALVEGGFLTPTGKTYRRENFTRTCPVRVNAGGNGVCVSDDGNEFIIYSENIGDAINGDTVEVRLVDVRRGSLIGEVTEVMKRKRDFFLALVTGRSGGRVFFRLLDIPGDAEMNAPAKGRDYPSGAYILIRREAAGARESFTVEEVFSADDEQFDFRRIQLKHALPEPHGEYRELKGVTRKIPREEIKRRKDFRKLLTVTIDGEDAKDFDDAVSLERDGQGYVLYVHIADVSHYVKKDGELDREAAARGTSYYLGDRVIPMLPEILSNDLCSLRHGEDRLSVTAVMRYDNSGLLTEHRFYESVIHVDRRLTYVEAEGLLSSTKRDKTAALLKELEGLAVILKKARMTEGRLDLNLAEEKMVYENGRIREIRYAERLMSHRIVEECMLSANVSVSRELKERKVPTIYRIHEDIEFDSLKKLQRFLASLDIALPLKGNSGLHLQKAVDSVAGREYEPVVNMAILKSLMQANYGTDPIGHYGLAFPDYTHFTSPIRRYPDLVVHRCLKGLMRGAELPYGKDRLTTIAETSSVLERIAQKAERDLVKLKSCRLMKNEVGKRFQGIVSGIGRYGFFVTLLDVPIEGMVPLRNLTDDYYLVMEDDYTVVGKRFGKRYRLGDRVELVLERASVEEMKIDFSPAAR